FSLIVQIIALDITGDKTHEFTNILQKRGFLSSIHTESCLAGSYSNLQGSPLYFIIFNVSVHPHYHTSFFNTALDRSPSSTISTSGKLCIYCLNCENP